MRFAVFRTLFCVSLALTAACGGCRDDNNSTSDAGTKADADMPADAASETGDASCVTTGCTAPSQCDESSGECVTCLDSTHCDDPSAPICRSGECNACSTSTQCSTALADGASVGETCRDDGRCVACERDADCTDSEPFCTTEGECVRCRDNDECPSVAPACEAGECRSCTEVDTCTTVEISRELVSRFCVIGIELEAAIEGESAFLDGLQATSCADAAVDFWPDVGAIRSAVDGGRITLDEDKFAECIAGEVSCAEVWVPQVPDGGMCWTGLECISGRCDDSMMCPGACEFAEDVGGPCGINRDCRSRLSCVGTTCVEYPDVGEDCANFCADGAYCDGTTCIARRDVSAVCANNGECLEELRCDAGTLTCTAMPGVGEICFGLAGQGQCADGVRCWKGICQDPQAVGSTCEATQQCEIGLRCVDDSCVEVLLPGAICQLSSHCALGLGCIDGRCSPLPDIGEPCFELGGCLRGECDMGTGVCTGLPDDAPCTGTEFYFDVFDPCGDTSSCSPDGLGGAICLAEGSIGSVCGTFDPPCATPETTCNNANVCELVCAAQAP